MRFSVFLRSVLLSCLLLAGLNGCSSIPEPSWWHQHKSATQNPPAAPSTAAPERPPVATEAAAPHLPPPRAGKAKVALLLPLSGASAPLGQAMLNAAQQAVFDAADSHFELMPRDTGADAAGAARAAEDAIAGGAELLIGPLFAGSVSAVRPLAEQANINMLALTTDTSLAGGTVFVMGFAPEAQVERAVMKARAAALHNFAALIPQTAYGNLVRRAFERAVNAQGGTVQAVEEYDPVHGAGDAIRRLAARRAMIEALLLPLGGAELAALNDQLDANDLNGAHLRLLGTGLWDEPGLGKTAPVSVGGWYAAPDPRARQNFIATYVKGYGVEPPRLATLAYDATALAATLAKRNRPFDRAALTNPNGFAGLDGIFRLTDNGTAERGLAVLEIAADGARVIDPAPASFPRARR